MGFDSVFFISCLLPVGLILYWLIPGNRGKNVLLLLLSLLFYAFGSISALGLLLAAAVFNFLWGRLLRPGRKGLLILGVGANLAYLFVFKYLHFFLNQVVGVESDLGLAAPLGMSFFLFKAISFLVDTYRCPENTNGSFWDFLQYLSFFPQVTAGPIARYDQFAPQLASRRLTIPEAAAGIRRFIVGLGKKVLLCTTLAQVADGVFALESGSLNLPLAWLGAACYLLQIYFDFSGYSDMAIGLGQTLGFSTPENFRYPYAAASIGDFWRRWHLSLSYWFRDYVYIPLGGNRKGKYRTALNKVIVFALCGVWHGAAWTFLAWGLWHGLFSALESLGIVPVKRLSQSRGGRGLLHVYTLLVVCLGFVLFRAESLVQAGSLMSAMFAGFSFPGEATVAFYRLCTRETLGVLVLGVVLSLPVKPWLEKHPPDWTEPLAYAGCLVMLALCMMKLAAGGFAPFIYAQF